jgi:hypothetical protein
LEVAAGLVDEGGDREDIGDHLEIADMAASGQERLLEQAGLGAGIPEEQDVRLPGGEVHALIGFGQVRVPCQLLVGEPHGLVPSAQLGQAIHDSH